MHYYYNKSEGSLYRFSKSISTGFPDGESWQPNSSDWKAFPQDSTLAAEAKYSGSFQPLPEADVPRAQAEITEQLEALRNA